MFEIKEFSINDPNLEIIWKKLEDGSSPFIFQTFDWCKNWFDKVGTHNQQEKFIILVAFENNKPLVLFPFVLKSNRLFRKVEFFGGDQSDYNSPLYSTLNFSFSDLWKEVLKSLPAHDLMILKRIPEFIEVNKNPITSLTNIKVTGNAQYLNLDPDEIKENFISKRSKKDIERMIRRLSELGN